MKIEATRLRMIRGDTETLTVTCETQAGAPRPFVEGDTVTFTVGWPGGGKVLQKTVTRFTDGAALIRLDPGDTGGLVAAAYRYDVQLSAGDGTVKTIVPPGDFILEEDVTRE